MPRKRPEYTKELARKGEERRRLTEQLVDLVGRVADEIVATVPDGTEIRAPWSVSDRLRIVEYRSSVDSYRALAVVQGAPGWETQAAFVRGRTPGSSFYLHRDFGCQIHVASREDYLNLANHLPEVVRAFEAREDSIIAALREGFERLKAVAEAEPNGQPGAEI